MGYKSLAEAVILQSAEDLWDPSHCGESKVFFRGDGFKLCAEIAEMNSINKYKFIHLLGGKNYVTKGKAHST